MKECGLFNLEKAKIKSDLITASDAKHFVIIDVLVLLLTDYRTRRNALKLRQEKLDGH